HADRGLRDHGADRWRAGDCRERRHDRVRRRLAREGERVACGGGGERRPQHRGPARRAHPRPGQALSRPSPPSRGQQDLRAAPHAVMSDSQSYTPPKVWKWDAPSGGRFANINRPIAGATSEKELPVGKHALQLYSLATPNGVKVTVLLEELLALA